MSLLLSMLTLNLSGDYSSCCQLAVEPAIDCETGAIRRRRSLPVGLRCKAGHQLPSCDLSR
jgi:hypothetical protein